MKNRRDFLRNTLGLSASLAASPRLFAASQESGAGMDMKHMDHSTERGSGRIVSVETPARLPLVSSFCCSCHRCSLSSFLSFSSLSRKRVAEITLENASTALRGLLAAARLRARRCFTAAVHGIGEGNRQLRRSSKREANSPNPAVIVCMELCRSDLDTAADSEAQSLGNLKHAKNDTRRQECLLLA